MPRRQDDLMELRAKEGNYIVTHPLVEEALATIKDRYVESIIMCDLRDDNLKTKFMMALKMLRAFENQLKSYIIDGQLDKIKAMMEETIQEGED